MIVIEFISLFLLWNFMIYVNHRLAHIIPFYHLHEEHHRLIEENINYAPNWKNYFLFLDNWKVTVDNWIIEVIPTLIFSYITGFWIFSIIHYVWTAFFQEYLEHSEKLDIYPITTGKWHMIHHWKDNCNYGLFLPIWDKIFRTEIR